MEMYLVAGFVKPTKKERDEDGKVGTVVIPVTAVVADSPDAAVRKAWRLIGEEHADVSDDRLEVRCIPFR